MKNSIIRFILIICTIGTLSTLTFADNLSNNQEIVLKKGIIAGPPYRTPSLYPVSFNGILFMDEITISAQYYTGEITVQITGTNGSITQTLQISETENATINVSSLPEGAYSIQLVTVDKGTFIGEFELTAF